MCMSDLMKDICACPGLIKCGQTKGKLSVNSAKVSIEYL